MDASRRPRRTAPHTVHPAAIVVPFLLIFNYLAVTYKTNTGVPVTVDTATLVNGAINGLVNATHLEIVLHTGAPDVIGTTRLNLAHIMTLRSLKINIVYDSQAEEGSRGVIEVWKAVLAILRSIPATTQMRRLELCSPLPRAALRSGWSRSPFVRVVARTMWNVDACLFGLMAGAAPVDCVKLLPPHGERFATDDWCRAAGLFPSLSAGGMLEF
ncbi:hypothetical protein PsYK624_081290 [Phanerochaete sordida]|uniref:Uncharacterized protein n=1 Tax=Phanerochaete sordida TaxID=48140 RepID=A0A9P3LFF8_9APHY|nr:hypothetical protein PsYK624_081290 [Phanerochaete sordida]